MKNRTIENVINTESGLIIQASDFFQKSEDEIFDIRYKLEVAFQTDSWLYICDLCNKPVKISGVPDKYLRKKILHFRHILDSSECPYNTGKNLSKEEILRRQYQGQKEGKKHFDLKNKIGELLSKNKNVTKIAVDKRRYSEVEPGKWRRPDVYAEYKGHKIVFEIQLSRTFLSVVVERNIYYQKEQTFVIWIFDDFEKEQDLQKFTEKDIYHWTKKNAFVLDTEAIRRSEDAEDIVLSCYYEKPILDTGEIHRAIKKNLITLADLNFNNAECKAYFFDFKDAEKKLEATLHEKEEKILNLLRRYYKQGKVPVGLMEEIKKINEKEWKYIRTKLIEADSGLFLKKLIYGSGQFEFLGFIVKLFFNGAHDEVTEICYEMTRERTASFKPITREIERTLCALISVKINKVVDYGIQNLLWLSNTMTVPPF